MRRIATPLLLIAFALTAGCSDSPVEPADPLHPPAPSPSISDAAHGGGAGFHFLPPMGDEVTPAAPFDGALAPVVTICEGASTDCASPVAEFTTTTGPGSETVRVDPDDEHYIVDWHTDRFALDPSVHYRVTVSVVPDGATDGLVLGYADVDLLATAAGRNDVDTDAFVPLVDGATLPIKFRIEDGIVGRIEVAPASATIPVGATQSFTATLYDLHGAVLTAPEVAWSSDDETVATVDGSGLATATGAGTILITAASQRVSDDAALTVIGASTAGALDLNGDGLADLMARGKPPGFSFTPDVLVHLNEGAGVEAAPSTTIPSPSFAGFASSGWNPGDLDGDGHGDVIIAAEGAGAIHLFRGTSTGAETVPDQTVEAPSGKTGCSRFAGAGYCFGASVATGDVDGDGLPDLVVGALEYLYVFNGTSSGFSTLPDQTLKDPLFSSTTQDGYGQALAVGDFDGDGYDDVAMGAARAGGGFNGQVYVYRGTTAGLTYAGPPIAPPAGPCPYFCGFGTSVAADDFDGDGFDDLVVGAPRAVFRSGAVFLYTGSASGLASTPRSTVVGTGEIGSRLAPLGDFDGDGDPDLAATGPFRNVAILSGGASGLTLTGSVQGPGSYEIFGQVTPQTIVGIGDVNSDGLTDLAVSQSMLDPDGDFEIEGSLWVYYGGATDVTTPDLELEPARTFEYGLIDGLGYNPRAD